MLEVLEAARPAPGRLYHYTCRDMARLIGTRGHLKPRPQPVLGGIALVWLTTDVRPSRASLGLERHTLPCDRMAVRYVDLAAADYRAVAWWPDVRRHFHPAAVDELEHGAPGHRPDLWWITAQPVAVHRDRRWHGH